MNPEWVDIAANDIGNPESLGPNDSPFLRRMWAKLSGSWLLGQPWCGGFIAHVMQQCAIPYPKDYYRAKSWVTWGTPCDLVVGAIVVLEREGGGHVFIATKYDPVRKVVYGIGGNQHDSINESGFERSRVIAQRWPPGKPFEAISLPLVSNRSPISRNEA